MLTLSAILFAIAALGGITLAVMHFRARGKTDPSTSLAMLHGTLAAVAAIFQTIGNAATRHPNVAAVAMANKTARIAWAMIRNGLPTRVHRRLNN